MGNNTTFYHLDEGNSVGLFQWRTSTNAYLEARIIYKDQWDNRNIDYIPLFKQLCDSQILAQDAEICITIANSNTLINMGKKTIENIIPRQNIQ